jgi:hypothetical protein
LIVTLVAFSSMAAADTLELVNGQTVEGTFVGRADGKVQFEVNGIVTSYDAKDVKNIAFGSDGQPSAAPATAAPAAKADAPSGAVTVPAGTIIMVRIKDALDTSRHRAGHKFTAALEADLVVNNTVVAPRGATLYGELTQAKQARRLAGKSEMTITFTGLMINNQIRPISTGAVRAVAESGSGRDTVGKTARGAAIGGLIDGRDGARTGAKVGLGAAILTRGGRINIPPNTLLEVPFAAPFTP